MTTKAKAEFSNQTCLIFDDANFFATWRIGAKICN